MDLVTNTHDADSDGETALMRASKLGNIDGVRFTLYFRSDVNAKSHNNGVTALHMAVKNKHFAVVSLLLDSKASIDALTTDNNSALSMACANPDGHEMATMLLSAGAHQWFTDELQPPPADACDDAMLRLLFEHRPLSSQSKAALAALNAAIVDSNRDRVQILVDAGVCLNRWFPSSDDEPQPGLASQSPLYTAVSKDLVDLDIPVCRILLKAGANPMYPGRCLNSADAYPLSYLLIKVSKDAKAASVGGDGGVGKSLFNEMLEYVTPAQVNLRIPAKYEDPRDTLLMLAMSGSKDYGYNTSPPEIVKKLVAAGANVNYQPIHGDAPLICAFRDGYRYDVVETLLNARADLRAVNENRESALHRVVAYRRSRPDVINLLMNAGADTEAVDKEGYTPMMRAVELSSSLIFESLMGWGARCDVVNFKSETVFMCAVKAGYMVNYRGDDFDDSEWVVSENYDDEVRRVRRLGDDPHRIQMLAEAILAQPPREQSTGVAPLSETETLRSDVTVDADSGTAIISGAGADAVGDAPELLSTDKGGNHTGMVENVSYSEEIEKVLASDCEEGWAYKIDRASNTVDLGEVVYHWFSSVLTPGLQDAVRGEYVDVEFALQVAKIECLTIALHDAIKQNRVGFASALLDAKADVNARTEDDEHMLCIPCARPNGHDMVTMLLSAGALASFSDEHPPPLTHACDNDMLRLLLKSRPESVYTDEARSGLKQKILSEDVEGVMIYIDAGIQLSRWYDGSYNDWYDYEWDQYVNDEEVAPLAVAENMIGADFRTQLCEIMLDAGANPMYPGDGRDAPKNFRNYPLLSAMLGATLHLTSDEEERRENEDGNDSDNEWVYVDEMLLDMMLDSMTAEQLNEPIAALENDGIEDEDSVLLLALCGCILYSDYHNFCHPRILKKLIAAGANVNYTTARGKTAFLIAYRANIFFHANTRLLLEAGADVRCVDDEGRSVLHEMAYLTPEIINTLVDAGADIEAVDMCGFTPLLQAAKSGSLATVEALLDKKARCDQRSYAGETVFMCATVCEPVPDPHPFEFIQDQADEDHEHADEDREHADNVVVANDPVRADSLIAVDGPVRIRVLVEAFLAQIARDASAEALTEAPNTGNGINIRTRKRDDSASPMRHARMRVSPKAAEP